MSLDVSMVAVFPVASVILKTPRCHAGSPLSWASGVTDVTCPPPKLIASVPCGNRRAVGIAESSGDRLLAGDKLSDRELDRSQSRAAAVRIAVRTLALLLVAVAA